MKLVKKIASENHLGRIVLTSNFNLNPYLLYSSSVNAGILNVFNTHTLQEQTKIFCHNAPVLKIAMNFNGSLAATSSTYGTMIRVYSIPDGQRLYTFTRGLKMTTQYYLNFSRTDLFLLSTSETGTIHCFNLEEAEQKTKKDGEVKLATPSGWFNFFIPKQCDDYLHSLKSSLLVNHANLAQKYNICAVNLQNTHMYAFNSEGEFLLFDIDLAHSQLKFVSKKHIDDPLQHQQP
mmetsp:Transcript_16832/g.12031  ORF Transcript_16832/g.12031 Transcript_16832/m.12031 type:complete len:234 (+) Transcript_16832:406-1107(+)